MSMEVRGPQRPPVSSEPVPWLVLIIIAMAAAAVVASAAAQMIRSSVVSSAREQRWRIQHEALLREATQPPAEDS